MSHHHRRSQKNTPAMIKSCHYYQTSDGENYDIDKYKLLGGKYYKYQVTSGSVRQVPSDIMTSELHLLLSISSRTQVRIFRQRVNTEKKATAVSQKLKKKKGNGISHVGFSDFGHIIVTSPQELFCHMTGK